MNTTGLAVLDPSVIETIRSLGAPGEPDIFAEVACLFLAEVPAQLSALHAAIAQGSAESVGQIAHRLRGSALEIGALRMAPVCAAIEYAARAGSLEDAAGRADSLGQEFAATREALQQAACDTSVASPA